MTRPAPTQPARPRPHALTLALLASTALAGLAPARAEPLPTGGQVVSGSVAIGTPHNGALAITQASPTAIVNWQGFSIGPQNRVDIRQPDAQAAILNRVTGQTRSTIAGQLTATGQVYLVNPNGISITRTGRVAAGGGFVASTLGIADEEFRAGRRQFRGSGASAPVTNHGTVTIGRGGYAALIGGQVANRGTIAVPLGKVGLGSGERATLDLSGDGFLQVAVPTSAQGRGALVSNAGTLSADGGSVVLTAAAARDLARQAVNLSGTIEARTVSGRPGRITLSGGDGAVAVTSTGRLDASGAGSEDGGRVRLTGRRLAVAGRVDVSGGRGGRARLEAGEHLALSGSVAAEGRAGRGGRVVATAPGIAAHAALIEASGATGGGVVRLGGGRQGQGRLAHARNVDVDAATTIRADATVNGAGGDVVVWSDAATRFAGTITARGGAQGGNGGQAEVSSKGVLSYAGFTDLTAAKGSFGTLLLDPYNVTIANGAQTTGGGFTADADDSVINAGTLLTALGSANVTVSTGTAGNQAGSITLAAGAPLSWNTGATLTLQAAGAVTLDSAISAPAGGLTIAAGPSSPSTASAAIAVARFTLVSGDWVQNSATLPGFAAGDFRVGGGPFLRAAGGTGTSGSPYRLTDIYGVQGMGTSEPYRAARYQLAAEIDARGTAAWNAGIGFAPVANNGAPFTGTLDGAGHTITGLTIARPGQNYVGLIGSLGSGGRVSSLGLVGGSVTGANYVGSLVGYNTGGTVSQSYTTGSVTGGFVVGGLVGANEGGEVNQSYASGSVTGGTGSSYVGGLVGLNTNGAVRESYATGSVTGAFYVGGLVGSNGVGTVSRSYASGRVTGSTIVGGLVGINGGTIATSYWDTQSTGRALGVGLGSPAGATGLTSAQARDASSYASWDFSTVWYQAGDLRPILRSEAVQVGGVYQVSNLHQLQLMGAALGGSYVLTRDLDASATAGTATSPGPFGAGGFVPVGSDLSFFNGRLDGAGHTITGLTSAQARSAAYYASWDFSTVWYQAGDLRPILRSEAVQVGGVYRVSNLHQLQLMGADLGGSYILTRDLDASATTSTAAAPGPFGAGGFVPVGSDLSPFTGRLDGVGHTITGLTISRPSQDYVGLIGYLGTAGSVSGIGLVGGSVAGRDSSGSLVGHNSGGTVSRSYASGSVTGYFDVGGLVGYNSGGTVSESYASGSVSGNSFEGGLVGTNDGGRVSQSYATGSVTGSIFVGGLVGNSTNGATVNQSYATGSVTGTTFVGGLVGSSTSTVTTSYWDTQSTGRANGIGGNATGATGLTTAQMQDLSAFRTTYAGFDFATVWAPPNQAGQGGLSTAYYPQLYGTSPVVAVTPVTSRPYGDANPPLIASYAGLQPGDFVTTLGSLTTGATATSDVGSYAATAAGSAITSPAGTSYRILYVPGTLSVTPRPVTVTADAQSRLYGEANPSLTYTTTSLGAGAPLSGTLATADATTGIGSYAITQGTLTASANPNYLLTYVGANLTVTPRPLTVTGGTISRVYGDANPATTIAFTAPSGSAGSGSGLVNGDTIASVAVASATADATSGAGGYAFTPGGARFGTGSAGNYQISYAPGTLSVVPRPVTVTVDAQSRLYGEANPSLTYTTTSLGVGAPLSGTLATADATTGVGSYAITQGTLTASANPNYLLTYVGANLTVTPRPLTVTGGTISRVYGDTNPTSTTAFAAPSGSAGSGSGLVNGDTIASVAVASATADATTGVGSYAFTPGGARFGTGSAGNYQISYAPGTLSIVPRPVTVTVDAQSRLYGDTNPSLTYTTTSLGSGAALSGSLTTTAGPASDVDTYAITQGTLTASANPNYALNYVGANLAVTPRPLTVTGGTLSRVYGDANPATTTSFSAPTGSAGTGSGLVNGDTIASVALASATADATSGVGSYGFTPGSARFSAGSAGNYLISYAPGTLLVTARPITITADAQRRLYGEANPSLTYTVGGRSLVNGDGLSGSLATAATATSGVGPYAITQGTLAASANYALTYQGANLTVTARPITVTANAQSRVYGDANPALTFTVGGRGLVTGDSLAGNLATTADATSGIGSYAIAQGTLAASANYAVTYQGANLTVTTRPITVTANAQSRVYGDANPALTYTVSGRGLVNGDSLSGSLATTASATSGVGPYAITQGSLAASANYSLTYQGADLTVTARPITVTAEAQSRVYGEANTALTYRVGGRGLVTGDSLSGNLATTASAASSIGSYAITQGTLSASANYALTYQGADLTVTARPIIVTANAQGREYGEANPALTSTVGGRGLVNGDSLTGGPTTVASATSGVGPYAITQGTLSASANYSLTYQGADLTVTARPITVTANAQSRDYGDANPSLTYTVGGRGLVTGDGLSGGLAITAGSTSGVGRYAITQGTLAASANYAVTYQGADLTVTARPITVTANAQSRVYGDANPALTYMVGGRGLVTGDGLSGGLATAATATSGIGAYAITQGSLAASANYALTYQGASLTVTPRPLTVLADPQVRLVGEADPALTYRLGGRGLVTGDSLSGGLATTAASDSPPGPYPITQGTLAASGNYRLGFVGADLTVLPAPDQPRPPPPPLPIMVPATDLASTVERAMHREGRAAGAALPLLLGLDPAGALVAADPRFDAALVCLGTPGGCVLTPLIPLPPPQASLSAAAR